MSPLQERLRGAESGRPFLFVVQRDAALEAGDAADVAAVSRRAELWERPPEEWEWYRLWRSIPRDASLESLGWTMSNRRRVAFTDDVDWVASNRREYIAYRMSSEAVLHFDRSGSSYSADMHARMALTAEIHRLESGRPERPTLRDAMRSAYRDATVFGTAILPIQFGARS